MVGTQCVTPRNETLERILYSDPRENILAHRARSGTIEPRIFCCMVRWPRSGIQLLHKRLICHRCGHHDLPICYELASLGSHILVRVGSRAARCCIPRSQIKRVYSDPPSGGVFELIGGGNAVG